MQILNTSQINQKIDRLAYQIYENNYNEKEIILAGINNKGMAFANLLAEKLKEISKISIVNCNISLNPAQPKIDEIVLSLDKKSFKNKVVIIVDDVANTGRTIFFSFGPLLEIVPKKIEVAVLIDRKHKNFPIKVDYIGLELATTLKENIRVELNQIPDMAVYLE